MMLNFGDPAELKTKKIVFEDVYPARDSATLEHLKELSSKRRVLEESINKSSSITEAIAREISGGLTSRCQQDLHKLEQYLPLLGNLVCYVASIGLSYQMVQWNSELKIRWTSALSSSSFFNFGGPKFFQINSLAFELCMTLFLYGAKLREKAAEILSTDLVQSATLYREAAGIFQHLVHEVLPTLQPTFSAERPPEATASVCTAMTFICLAEAQAVTIRKAEEKGTTASLLAKLHYGVTQFLNQANDVLYSRSGECKDLSSRFMDFLSCSAALHEFRSRKYIAESLRAVDQVGLAVAVVRSALVNLKQKLPGEESWKSVFIEEISGAVGMLNKIEHENEFILCGKIPLEDEVPLPEGIKMVSIIPYCPKRWERELVFKM